MDKTTTSTCVATIGIDLGKRVFQMHGIDALGEIVTWAKALLQRKPFKVAAVALANKTARIAWAVLTRGETYQAGKAGAAAVEAA